MRCVIKGLQCIRYANNCILFIGIVPFLVKASISLDEGVATTLLQLLQCALCGSEVTKGPQPQGSASGTSPAKQKKTKDKDKDKDKNEGNNLTPFASNEIFHDTASKLS